MAEHTERKDLASLASSIQAVASPFRRYLSDLHETYQSLNEGAVADYIPELTLARSEWFGICVTTMDGRVFEVGDCDQPFTIQSISKAFVYGLALEDHGREYVNTKVGVEPTGEAFNSIVLDEATNRPYNPMVNAGAIATTDLVEGNGNTERLKRMLDMFRRYTGRSHTVDMPVSLSEKATGFRNRAIAYLMLNFGMVSDRIDETLDLYFQQCSILVTARDLAMMAATLANQGINPVTGERALDAHYVQDVISVMMTCGMYDYSGEWAYRVGMPAKSGVGGGITALVPGKLGIGTFSPLLDAKGNSVRGIKVCEDLSRDFGLHIFNCAPAEHDLTAWLDGDRSVDEW
ncbi:MAG: glutaminase A [Synechococcales bacterium]|nr:glutaminase A [Synechococcales bacterium]